MCTASALSAYVLKDFGLLQLQLKFKQLSVSVLVPLGGSNCP